MRLKKVWRNIFGLLTVLAVVSLVVIFLVRITPKPPLEDLEYARITLSQATTSNAGTYSKKTFNEARALYDSAMVNWKRENKKFVYLRNYDKVKKFSQLSAKKSEQAMIYSKTSASSLKIKIKQKIDTLNNVVTDLNNLFASYPLTSEIRRRISNGKMLLNESKINYGKGEYLQANKKITDAEYLLTASYESAISNLKEYFKSYPTWKRWVDSTIAQSRATGGYSIIVDKYSRKCYVYLKGAKKYEYNIELGKNWVGDKKVKGDKATPEGMYQIVKKFGSNKTKYYKALLLNYPNNRDRVEFNRAVAAGTLPHSAKIGGLIEIHGNGGKGVDWTEGCIALTDSEMDVIFRIAQEGTPVTIVGSMSELKQILD